MIKKIPLIVLALLVLSLTANAYDITGRWYVNANGWTYVMDLTQQGKMIYGSCFPQTRTRHLDAIVYGEINEERIRLGTSNKDLSVVRHFEGFLFTAKNGMAMTGVYTENNRHGNRWHAVKYD